MVPIIAAAAIALTAICNPLVKYGFGKEYMPVLAAMHVLLIGVIFKSAGELVTTYLLAINRPGINSFIRLLSVSVNILFLSILVPLYGLMGGCIATTLSYTLEGVTMILVFRKMSGIKSWRLLMLNRDDIIYLHDTIFSLATRFKPQL